MTDCIFCKIASGEIPSDFVYQDENVAAFRDLNPQAPVHVLVIPKRHYASSATVDDPSVWSSLMSSAVKIARKLGLEENGYRMVINTGEQGGQSVPHLHLHLLAGRNLGWPPG
ncbi:MAG: histidine triad nucleotide-binding protein [Synergistaceae bacterium]|nr:histidine triad nucleotide-binding protein [Synergistaceae bacterium]MBQ6918892.1 histidine triad nucleotide-binding protein [Synergistaceae bacterium]MBQ6969473.1 histidine triad nucleotide-binding protein [Synergistaceae bacterium]